MGSEIQPERADFTTFMRGGLDPAAGQGVEAHRYTAGGGGVDPSADRSVPGVHQRPLAVRGLPPDRAARAARGEAAGLRWCDIDLDHKVAYISWQIQYTGSALVLCPLKTAASKRVLDLDATTVRVLRRYREEQDRWYRAHGRIPSGYVFTTLDGGPMSPDYLTQTFTQLVKASGLPPVRLHDLRHGAASLALAAGVDLKVVADQLRHCSIVLAADTYISVAAELALSAAETMARLVLRAGRHRPAAGKYVSPAPRPGPSSPLPDRNSEQSCAPQRAANHSPIQST
jgi:hypothetical protein